MKRNDLIQVRKEKRRTQQEVAKSAGINRSYYGLIENGNRNPSLIIAIKIADYLDVDLSQIFKNEIFFNEKCYKMQTSSERSN